MNKINQPGGCFAPTLTVTENNATPTGEMHQWATEASDLRIAPGNCPTQLATNLGNGCDFMLVRADNERLIYRQGNGSLTLIVYND